MKHITKHFDENIYTSNALDFYFKGMKIGVLDIETTGLDPSRNKFILGGLFDIQSGTMHQFFAESRSEEKQALEKFYELISDFDMVITYNGKHFDMPFIARRMKAHGIGACNGLAASTFDTAALLPYNLDLYLVVNGHSPIKKFVPNLKQKTVENYMGLWQSRDDEISGAESVELYNKYEKSGDPELESKILLHNSDDVLQLTRLIKVLSKCDIHKAMYHLGFPVFPKCNEGKGSEQNLPALVVEKIKTEKNSLFISGRQIGHGIDYMGFSYGDWPAESRFDSRNMSFSMQLPVLRERGLCIIDLDAAGLDRETFEKYPSSSSGFLVLEDHNDRNFMETNHFVKAFIEVFMADI
ncbi:MAG: ribonuclease H-like domain-containing protein [Firmicutes bacterium]|nr:ribonuclease H-like domain-containing protein [Bacillota bacterium]